ncbi:MAG: hypothetical protein Q7S74_04730 [Nanoarchaeota archaeon]|nr:hypothetical protein [Nanoarchaeota archaeon]
MEQERTAVLESAESSAKSVHDVIDSMRFISQKELNEAKEKAINEGKKKAFWFRVRNAITFSGYEVSPTYFEPTLINYQAEKRAICFFQLKPKGIERPYAKDILSRKGVKNLYHHESGVIGSLEKDKDGLHTVLRIPLNIVKAIGLEELAKDFPEIEKGLSQNPVFDRERVRAYVEGDLAYITEEAPIGGGEEFLYFLEKREFDAVEYRLNYLALKTKKVFPRSLKEIKDFGTAADLKESKEKEEYVYRNVSNDSCGNCFRSRPYIINGLMGRVIATSEFNVFTDLRLPVLILKDLRERGIKTGISLVDQYMLNDSLRFENIEIQNKENNMTYSIRIMGDLVYDKLAIGKESYPVLKRNVDKLGERYLEEKKNLVFL